MRRILLSIGLFAGVLSAIPAHAQIAIYGEFTAADFNTPNNGWEYGTTFGIYDNRWHVPFFALGVDGRGSVVHSGNIKTESGLVGPRLVFKPHVLPIMPYVEALGGVGHIEQDFSDQTERDDTKFQYGFLAGFDWTIIPRFDWRVAEFSYGGVADFSGSYNPKQVSTGIVFRLP